MSKQVALKAHVRTELGKGPTGRLRKTGRVPGVMYGHDVTPTPVDVDALELYHVLHTEAGRNVMIKLEVDGEVHLSIARELQRHPVMGDITHLDFLAVNKNQAIVVEVPVHTVGEPADAAAVVQQVLTTIPVSVKPLEVPNEVIVSLEGLTINDVVRVQDIPLPEGCIADMDADRTVITINAPTVAEVEEEAGVESMAEFAGEGEPAEAADGE